MPEHHESLSNEKFSEKLTDCPDLLSSSTNLRFERLSHLIRHVELIAVAASTATSSDKNLRSSITQPPLKNFQRKESYLTLLLQLKHHGTIILEHRADWYSDLNPNRKIRQKGKHLPMSHL